MTCPNVKNTQTLDVCLPANDCSNNPELTFAYDNSNKYEAPNLCVGSLDYSTSECAKKESDYLASLQAEVLNAAGGPVNIFPLLGVHNQGSTMNLVSDNGYPISNGTPSGFNLLNAFKVGDISWRSIDFGEDVLKNSYIGYCFGTKKAWDKIGEPKERYFTPQPIRYKIGTIRLKQGSDSNNRITQARIEASDDGINWHRVDVVNIPDTSELVTINIRSIAAYNSWRIVPLMFNGIVGNYQWEVLELQLAESTSVNLDDIQDFFLLENRDRSYCRTSIMLKCQYDLLDVQTELAKFGISLPQTYIFTASFAMMINVLGRPIVVGDIIELPGEVQYDAKLQPVRKWLEVTDTAWSTEGYSHTWKPLLFKFNAQPIMPSAEHRDILGLPGQVNQAKSDDDFLNGLLMNDLAYKSTEAIKQHANEKVPFAGADGANIMSGKPLIGKPGKYDGNDLYVEDAIPPDGKDFTVGDQLPASNDIQDGHYHRQTYSMLPAANRPADRLLQWNASKKRWILIETNNRYEYQSNKQTIAKILNSDTKFNPDIKL